MNDSNTGNDDALSEDIENGYPTDPKKSPAAGENSESESSKQEPAAQPTIHLDQFLKTCGVATGGQAKRMIQGGEILVNDEIETRRRKQLRPGDEVTLGDVVYVVTLNE
ncbi:MAG: RNA-binding S4 domain-containing protein [Mariniblastus sp.]